MSTGIKFALSRPVERSAGRDHDWAREVRELRLAIDEHAFMAVTDSEGRMIFANDRLCAISRYERCELLGSHHRILDSGYHPPEFFVAMRRTLQKGLPWHGEIRNRAKDGSHYWVATTILALMDEHSGFRQYIAIGSDITERKRVESELEEKLKLQKLLAALSSRFIGVPSGQVDAAIGDAQRLVGETLGLERVTLWHFSQSGSGMVLTHSWQKPGLETLPPGFPQTGELPWLRAVLQRGETICFSSVDELPPEAARDAETLRALNTKSALGFPLISEGRTFGALGFSSLTHERQWRGNEIAELKLIAQIVGNVVRLRLAEMRADELRDELSHTMRVATMGELATALAHELNQPLAAILTNAQAAQRFLADGEMDPTELADILADIVRNGKRAGAVVHNLRSMVSRRQPGREACCLNGLLREVIELLHGELVETSVEIRAAFARDLPPVEGAGVELQQVLVNLLMNAVQAMRDHGSALRLIEAGTALVNGMVEVVVRDRGPGIVADQLEGIFEPFYSTKEQGLGMGLAICRRITESHGGSLRAGNHAEGGAVFTLSLPVARASSQR